VATAIVAAGTGIAVAQGAKPLSKCAPDAVVAGTVCVDRWEASLWRVPNATGVNAKLVKRIRQGKATYAQLAAAGALLLGIPADNYAPCADDGTGCSDVFALSLPGIKPSAYLTWFQAKAACANAGKRLPTNAEWQAAAIGTPDPGGDNGTTDCNTSSVVTAVNTGSRSACVSKRGAFDMVGNLWEWVEDRLPRSTGCGSWGATVSATGDLQCLAGAATSGEPGALLRGASFVNTGNAGPLSIAGDQPPSASFHFVGVRCVR
jgi:hypothetical protein